MTLICRFDPCDFPVTARGLCRGHYSQQWTGKPLTPLRRRAKPGEPLAWLKQIVSLPTDECIEWPYARMRHGYGVVVIDRHNLPAHAAALNLVVPWHPPYGRHALHSCDNPPCVNPAHLSWGSQAENNRQMWDRGRARGYYVMGGGRAQD